MGVPGREEILCEMLTHAAEIARLLYERGLAFGSDANVSFICDDRVYITRRECGLYRIDVYAQSGRMQLFKVRYLVSATLCK